MRSRAVSSPRACCRAGRRLEGVGELEDFEVGLMAADDLDATPSIQGLDVSCPPHRLDHPTVVVRVLSLH